MRSKEFVVDLPKMKDARGNLSFMEECSQIPFKIRRVYWIYDVPCGQKRGSHAFKTQQEVIIALSGSFDVVLNDGNETRRYNLNRADKALYVPSKMWRFLENFSTNSVCLVISSGQYDEQEYIRNYRDFKKFLKESHDLNLNVSNTYHKSYNTEIDHSIFECKQLNLPVIRNRSGNLTYVHNSIDIPFEIKRIFFIYDIPTGKSRGMHAHKYCYEFILAASGSFSMELDDGNNKDTILINNPNRGVLVVPGIWKKQYDYSSGAICLVLASDFYNEDDYIRKYTDFKKQYGNRN